MDRAKDIIIRGGENISCAEVESAFYLNNSVMECAAFGIKDSRLGERVGVVVVRGVRARSARILIISLNIVEHYERQTLVHQRSNTGTEERTFLCEKE